jgi:hypothetical protein
MNNPKWTGDQQVPCFLLGCDVDARWPHPLAFWANGGLGMAQDPISTGFCILVGAARIASSRGLRCTALNLLSGGPGGSCCAGRLEDATRGTNDQAQGHQLEQLAGV